MLTISDIAQKAQVSRTLVSRVLNNKSGVSPENRAKILAIIEENHYVPSGLARSLVMQKTQTIGVVMDDLCNSYFFDLISGIQDAGEKLGYNILFCNGHSTMETKMKYVDYFSQGRTDGMIAYGSDLENEPLFLNMASKTSCFVLIEGQLSSKNINNIQLDNYTGAYKATTHLIKLGYHNILHFTGDMNYNVSLERLNGFVQAMHDNNMPIQANTIVYADYFEKIAYQQMNQLLNDGHRPDACFFGADKAAFGAIRAIYEHHLRIPEDIAIIGFDDDVPDSRDMIFPNLTTMQQPLYDMGKTSVELLVNSIENPNAEPQTKIFEPKFIIRDTCR
ncbi:MAG: LacI family DNA-binding transcriptional regulator [Lachnospiraceae bacterium]|nr:LacI family DNA-binding transcriptional regulator [Lachnospiraceae bacterium]